MEESFIQELERFFKERKAQRLRGLNNYNIMTVLRKEDAEVGMHSNFIYSLLDTNGVHGQDDLFVKLFAKHVLKINNFGKVNKVKAEDDANGRRIDFTIKSDKYLIGIEMKINANDQDKQIFDYYSDLVKKADNENITKSNVKIYYLTLNGKEASPQSLNKMKKDDYTRIAFNSEILEWLQASKKQVSNITNLNNAIGYYIDVIKMLIGDYHSPILQYKDFFLQSQDRYEIFEREEKSILQQINISDDKQLVINGLVEAKQELYDNFFKKLLSPLLNKDLKFKKYLENLTIHNIVNQDGSIIFLTLYKGYNIRIYFKKDKFATISIEVDDRLDKNQIVLLKSKLKNIDSEYITGRKKGKVLRKNHTIPERSIDNLFSAQKDEVEKLNDSIIAEIQSHIEKIKESLQN